MGRASVNTLKLHAVSILFRGGCGFNVFQSGFFARKIREIGKRAIRGVASSMKKAGWVVASAAAAKVPDSPEFC